MFVPLLLKETTYAPYKFVISFTLTFAITVLMMLHIRIWQSFPLGRAILTAAYGFAPVIFSAYICTFHFDAFLKAGICTAVSTVMFYFANYVIAALFGPGDNHYQVDFQNWEQCANGNIHLILLISFLLISAVLMGIGIMRIRKGKNG